MDIDQLRIRLAKREAELCELLDSWEFAFAYGHGCAMGQHPNFWITRDRHDKLMREIRDLKGLIQEHR